MTCNLYAFTLSKIFLSFRIGHNQPWNGHYDITLCIIDTSFFQLHVAFLTSTWTNGFFFFSFDDNFQIFRNSQEPLQGNGGNKFEKVFWVGCCNILI